MNRAKSEMFEKEETETNIIRHLSGDRMREIFATMRNREQMDEAGYAVLWWLYSYMQENNVSWGAIAKELDISQTTIHRVMHGKYGAELTNVLATIRAFKAKQDHKAAQTRIGFIETKVWGAISELLTNVLTTSGAGLIYGPSQAGKTECITEFCRRHGTDTAKVIRIPSNCHFSYLLDQLAEPLNVNLRSPLNEKRRKIIKAIDPSMILIFDECHQFFTTCSEQVAIRNMEYIREIHDVCKCGIVLCATDVLKKEISEGKHKKILEQFKFRAPYELKLPQKPLKRDVAKIIAYFELPKPTAQSKEAVDSIVDSYGIGLLIKHLIAASALASNKKDSINWDYFDSVYETLSALSAGEYNE